MKCAAEDWLACGLLPSKSALLTEKRATTKLNRDKIYRSILHKILYLDSTDGRRKKLTDSWNMAIWCLIGNSSSSYPWWSCLQRQCCQRDQTFAAIIDFLKSWFCKKQSCNINVILTTRAAGSLLAAECCIEKSSSDDISDYVQCWGGVIGYSKLCGKCHQPTLCKILIGNYLRIHSSLSLV